MAPPSQELGPPAIPGRFKPSDRVKSSSFIIDDVIDKATPNVDIRTSQLFFGQLETQRSLNEGGSSRKDLR